MSDQTEQPEPEPPALGDVGAWLRAGRKAKGVTVESVASALHLDNPVVEALEQENFSAIGATVFVKGHLRAVSQHLGLDVDEAMRRFNVTAGDAAGNPPDLIVSYNKPIRQSPEKVIWGIAAIVLIIVVLLGWWFWPASPVTQPSPAESSPTNAAPGSAEQQTMQSGGAETVGQQMPATTPSAGPAGQPRTDFAALLESAQSNAPQPAGAVPVPLSAPSDRVAGATSTERGLRLTFSAECWYEVRDADGDRIAMGTARAGTSRLVTGARPLAVTVGVADAVSLEVDGEPLAIAAADRRGRAARLTIR